MKIERIFLGLSAMAAACGGGGKGPLSDGQNGTLRFGVTADSAHDVAAVTYVIVPAGGDCESTPVAERTVPLEDEVLPPGVRAPGVGDGHRFADAFVTLEPGEYLVCATPRTETGAPSGECAPAQALATVIPGVTTEITLVSVCEGADTGGVDAVTVLDTPPHIDDLRIEPSKFITSCETATFEVSASDPEGDALTYEWQVVSGDAPLASSESTASFGPAPAGDYEVEVVVRDAYGQGARLVFPVHVSASDECPVCDAGVWEATQRLDPSDGGPADTFQVSVGVSGELALVGTVPDEDDEALPGVVYAFARSGTAWLETDTFTAPDAAPQDRFGNDIAIDGNTAIVGAFNAQPDGQPHRGAAYLFEHSGLGWSFAQKLVGPTTTAGSAFGINVALSGDTAAAASIRGTHLYRRAGASWALEQVLFGDVPILGSVAIDGDTLLTGYGCDPGGPIAPSCLGAAFVFVRSGTAWIEQQKLVASDAAPLTNFGTAVALAGDWAFVAAPFGGSGGTGVVYAYHRSGSAWTEQQILTGLGAPQSGQFGRQLAATTEDLMAVGTALHAFKLDAGAWTETQELLPIVEDANSGASDVALSGHTTFLGVIEGPPPSVKASATVFETCGE